MVNRGSRPREYLLPVGLFLLFLAALGLLLFFSNRPPQIQEIEPPRAGVGDLIRIVGSDFGEERGESRVLLAGQVPTSSRYRSWSDTVIELEVPQGASSGLLYVITAGGRSNPILFTNVESEPLAEAPLEAAPTIERLDSASLRPGGTVTIYGKNFGRRRADSRILFSGPGGSEIAVDQTTGGYLFWSEDRITVRVPPVAVDGAVRLVTRGGSIATEAVTVERAGGSVTYENPREYAVRQEVRLHDFREPREGTISIWLPSIQTSPTQRDIQILNESHPSRVELLGRAGLYEVTPPRRQPVSEESEEPPAAEEIRLARTFLFRRYSVSAEVEPGAIPEEYRMDEPFMRRYTGGEAYLPVENERVREFAFNSVGSVTNRVEQARWIYREALRLLEADPGGPGDPAAALEAGVASSAGYANLMVSALRVVEIPARTVSGILLTENLRSQPHHWVEFYLQDFGWFPADPARGDGIFRELLPPPQEETDPGEEYFGALDGRRVAFSYGTILTPATEMEQEPRLPESVYARMQTYEESGPNNGGYTSDWILPELIGSY